MVFFCVSALQSFFLGTYVCTSTLSLFNGHEQKGFGAWEIWKTTQVNTDLMIPGNDQVVVKMGVTKTRQSYE